MDINTKAMKEFKVTSITTYKAILKYYKTSDKHVPLDNKKSDPNF